MPETSRSDSAATGVGHNYYSEWVEAESDRDALYDLLDEVCTELLSVLPGNVIALRALRNAKHL